MEGRKKGQEEAATEDLLVQARKDLVDMRTARKGKKEEELVINDRDLFCFKVDE